MTRRGDDHDHDVAPQPVEAGERGLGVPPEPDDEQRPAVDLQRQVLADHGGRQGCRVRVGGGRVDDGHARGSGDGGVEALAAGAGRADGGGVARGEHRAVRPAHLRADDAALREQRLEVLADALGDRGVRVAEVEPVEAVPNEASDGGGIALDDGRQRRRRRIRADHERLRGRGDADEDEEHAEHDREEDATTGSGLGSEHAPSLGMARRWSYRTLVGCGPAPTGAGQVVAAAYLAVSRARRRNGTAGVLVCSASSDPAPRPEAILVVTCPSCGTENRPGPGSARSARRRSRSSAPPAAPRSRRRPSSAPTARRRSWRAHDRPPRRARGPPRRSR